MMVREDWQRGLALEERVDGLSQGVGFVVADVVDGFGYPMDLVMGNGGGRGVDHPLFGTGEFGTGAFRAGAGRDDEGGTEDLREGDRRGFVPHSSQDLGVVGGLENVAHLPVGVGIDHSLDDALEVGIPAVGQLAALTGEEFGAGSGDIAGSVAGAKEFPSGIGEEMSVEEAAVNQDEFGDLLGEAGGDVDGDIAAPRVAEEGDFCQAEGGDEAGYIGGQGWPVVAGGGLGGLAVAALVGGKDLVVAGESGGQTLVPVGGGG